MVMAHGKKFRRINSVGSSELDTRVWH